MDGIRTTGRALAHRLCGCILAALCLTLAGLPAVAANMPPAERAAAPLRVVPGLEEPLVATGATAAQEDAALAVAIGAFRNPAVQPIDFADSAKPFEAFLKAYPASAWRTAVLTNLGLGYHRAGYFTRAIDAFEQAWSAGQAAEATQAKALVDRTVGELVRIHARLGHSDRTAALLAELEHRSVTGPATEAVTGAREGLWVMRNEPGNAFLCGPMALKSLLRALRPDSFPPGFLNAYKSGPNGVALSELGRLAERAKLPHKLVFRDKGQPLPVPSIMHWKADHFAAIVGEERGRYHLKDPTVEGDLWVSKAALDAEGSGYFLVPDTVAVAGDAELRTVTVAEASTVHGKGDTPDQTKEKTSPDDNKTCSGGAGGSAMCVYAVHTMVVSLNLTDTPVGYTPAKGPDAHTTLTYNQREANQPAVFGFSNLGPKWTSNWLTYIQDDPRFAGSNVMRYIAGGGSIYYSGYSSTTGRFTLEPRTAAVLVRTGAAEYQRLLPDGSVETYAQSDGATTYPRRLFLTRKTDPAGNALSLAYDAQLRLTAVVDATGRSTTFVYGAANPLLVTRITDPFGRSAALTYDSAGRLASITDVIGITSRFTYDGAGLVNALTTPYGTTGFAYAGTGNFRWLEATDPLGKTERFEFRHAAPGIPFSESRVPSATGLNVFNSYINYRNTFYWDRHAYRVAAGDYTKARIEHWLHDYSTGYTSGTLESVKKPLEGRLWLSYPGQPSVIYNGSLDSPTVAARLLDDNTTQARSFTYNAFGKPLTAVDPVGRRTVFTYAANGIDLIAVQQQTSTAGALSTVAAFTYNSQHLPLTYTDAAGQVTRYAYDAAGQLVGVTNALNQTTSYGRDGFGRLVSVVNANGATQRSFTYDAFDRIATGTDSEGYTLAYGYDALDRITEVRYPDGTTTQRSYDKLDLAASKDRLGRVTTYAYDANRRLTAVTNPLGQVTRYGYYENGALASLTDPMGNTTSWSIDVQSRPTAKRHANGDTESYAYETTTSRLKALTDPMGQVRSYRYARDDRTTAMAYASAARPTPPVAFAYDAFFPRPTAMVDGIGTTTFQYHPVGAAGALQLAVEDGPYGNDAVAYQYDALGRIVARTVDSAAETFSYDRLGRVTRHDSALGAFALTYLGQTSQPTSRSNGVVGTAWTYDGNLNDRRLLGIGNSGQARSFGLATTPEARITALTESIGSAPHKSWNYDYDALDRLTGARASTGQNFGYTYDGADNLTAINGVSAAYNVANQITSLGGTPYAYDANGNLLDDGVRTYQWDAQDRLVGIGYKAQPGNATRLRYDGMGRRVGIVDSSSLGAAETRYLWCGDTLCQARNASDAVTRRYFPEGFVIPQGGTSLYYGVDQLGSVRDLLATQNGSRVAAFDYDAYGNVIGSSGRVASDFRYAGMFSHAQSGLGLTNYRAYDPRSARWLSRDPISEAGGLNLYGYVGGNPTSYTDVTGRCPLCLVFIVEAAIGGGIDLGIQLYNNGGRLDCVNWWEVGGSALAGGAGGVAFQAVAKAVLAARAARAAEVAAEGTTPLFRAVGPAELADINATGALRNLGSAEGKYFTTSAAEASAYAKQAVKAFGDPPYTIVRTDVPNSVFEGLLPATVDRGIPAWVIPTDRLPGLVPSVLNHSPLPPIRFYR